MAGRILFSFISIFFFFILLFVNAQTISEIEVLDIEKNEITKISNTPEIQSETRRIIEGIDNIVTKINPIPEKGHMVKIPLTPSMKIENRWMVSWIDEVIIIMPENEKPYLLMIDTLNKPHFFTTSTDMDALFKALDFSF